MLPRRISLVAQTLALLRQRLSEGEWKGLLPGEDTLSRSLGVSRVTLRAALAQLEKEGLLNVSKGRRREIAARTKRAAPTKATLSKVILLSPVALASLAPSKLLWIDELRDQLVGLELPLEFLTGAGAASHHPSTYLKELTKQHPDAAWVLLRSSAAVQQWFAASRLPVVVAGSRHFGIELACVDIDYHATCRHAAGRLIARGCERLAFLSPQHLLAGDLDSELGFFAGAGKHPVTVTRHDGTPDGLCRALTHLMQAPTPPHGILVLHSTHALTALSHLIHQGWQVPKQVKLIARDDDPFLSHMTPLPARYSLPPHAYATHIARIIRRFMDGEGQVSEPDLLLPEFIAGESV